MPSETLRDNAYLCPAPFRLTGEPAAKADEYLAWGKDIIADGRAFLRLQPAYPYIQEGMDIINGTSGKVVISTLSGVKTEMTLRNLKELIAAQTNIRIIPAFKSENPEYQKQTGLLNKAFMAWQTGTFADRSLRRVCQFAFGGGTGYAGVRYDPNFYYKGKGDIIIDAYGPLDVLPVGLPPSHDLQKAYAVALKVKTPLHEAWRLFPLYRDKLRPKASRTLGRGTVSSWGAKMVSPVLRKFGYNRVEDPESVTWDDIDIYYPRRRARAASRPGRPRRA